MPRNPDRLIALTGIRFFAAIAVVLYHFWQFMLPGVSVNPFVANGFMGVSLFFVLSGYILAYVYMQDGVTIDHGKFWVARFARVYPVYAFAFLLQVPFIVNYLVHSGAVLKRSAVAGVTLSANLLMLQGWYASFKWKWNYPSWSLCAEAFFYLLFPWLALRLISQLTTMKRILWAGLSSAVLMLVLPMIAVSQGATEVSHPQLYNLAVMSPLCRMPEFILGMCVARINAKARETYSGSLLARAGSWSLTFGIVGWLCVISLNERIPFILRYSGVCDLAFAATIFGLANSRGWIVRFLSIKPLELLGEASYSIYILQVPLMAFFLWGLSYVTPDPSAGHTLMNATTFAGYLLFLIVSSVACFKFMEAPLRRAIVTRYVSKRQEQAPTHAAAATVTA